MEIAETKVGPILFGTTSLAESHLIVRWWLARAGDENVPNREGSEGQGMLTDGLGETRRETHPADLSRRCIAGVRSGVHRS
jgi:hypothetical protein